MAHRQQQQQQQQQQQGYYRGFLGSEASRFPGQASTDIHFTDFSDNAHPKQRQRTVCVGPQLVHILAEEKTAPHPNAPWMPHAALLPQIVLIDHGPIPPAPQWVNPVRLQVNQAMINQAPVWGYSLSWNHIIHETHSIVRPRHARNTFHYYEHYRRTDHNRVPSMKPNGTHRVFRELKFGTQTQQYRLALG